MRNISSILSRSTAPIAAPDSRLRPLDSFGSNPGALKGFTYLPETLPDDAPLVVVLHGCTQNASDFARCSGWLEMADANGFALLFPEQQRANNMNLCFNWFEVGDIARDAGEPLSICQMIKAVGARHAIDSGRIFVTGLSAGGAMTAVMLATYPEVFAGGAIIAGLPFGVANSMPEAFAQMQGRGAHGVTELAAKVRAASGDATAWPRLSVWHGSTDHTVAPSNMAAIVGCWLELHALEAALPDHRIVDGHDRSVWSDAAGREVVEAYTIRGMGHGVPLATSGAEGCGVVGPHMLEAGISSTRHIARFWGIGAKPPAQRPQAARPRPRAPQGLLPVPESNVATVINNALRSAGLMK